MIIYHDISCLFIGLTFKIILNWIKNNKNRYNKIIETLYKILNSTSVRGYPEKGVNCV